MGAAWPYPQPAWVFSRRELPRVPGASLGFVQGDVRPVHDAMRAAAGTKNIWIVGGGDVTGQFFDAVSSAPDVASTSFDVDQAGWLRLR